MRLPAPGIEVTNDANGFCIGRPESKRDATLAFMGDHMRAEFLVDAFVPAFAEEVKINVAECG